MTEPRRDPDLGPTAPGPSVAVQLERAELSLRAQKLRGMTENRAKIEQANELTRRPRPAEAA